MTSSSFHAVAHNRTSFFFQWKRCTLVCRCTISSLSLRYDGHSGGFHFLAVVKCCSNMQMHMSLQPAHFIWSFELVVMFYNFPYCKRFSWSFEPFSTIRSYVCVCVMDMHVHTCLGCICMCVHVVQSSEAYVQCFLPSLSTLYIETVFLFEPRARQSC